jgi:hypothetical protein
MYTMSSIPLRVLATLDSRHPEFSQNREIHPGIKIASQMSSICRAVYFFFGWTVELQIGNNYYVVGRKSLEKMLLRHSVEAGLDQSQIGRGSLSWDELIGATKHFLEDNLIRLELAVDQALFVSDNSENDRVVHSFLSDFNIPSQEIKIWDSSSHFVSVNTSVAPSSFSSEGLFGQNSSSVRDEIREFPPHEFIYERIPNFERVPKGRKLADILHEIENLANTCKNPSNSLITLTRDDNHYLIQKLTFAIYCAHDPQRFGLEGNPFKEPVDTILANSLKFSPIDLVHLYEVISKENGLPLSMVSEQHNPRVAKYNQTRNQEVKDESLQRLKSQYREILADTHKVGQCGDLWAYFFKEVSSADRLHDSNRLDFLSRIQIEFIQLQFDQMNRSTATETTH